MIIKPESLGIAPRMLEKVDQVDLCVYHGF